MENTINITYITDRNYYVPMLVSVYSLIKNISLDDFVVTCIVTFNLNEREKRLLDHLKELNKGEIRLLNINEGRLNGIKAKNHVSKAAYIKLLLPDILELTDATIFIDSDTLVLGDVAELWRLVPSYEKKLGAAFDPVYDYEKEVLGLNEKDLTFNSGVMVLPLRCMRLENKSDELFKFVEEKNHLTKLNDQASFNSVYANNWYKIPISWNFTSIYYYNTSNQLGMMRAELNQDRKTPNIVHFTGPTKPWMYEDSHPFKEIYLKYLLSLVPEFDIGKVNVKKIIIKYLKKVRFLITRYR